MCFACRYVCVPSMYLGPKEVTRGGTGVTNSCGCWGPNPGPMQGQVLLTMEPSPQCPSPPPEFTEESTGHILSLSSSQLCEASPCLDLHELRSARLFSAENSQMLKCWNKNSGCADNRKFPSWKFVFSKHPGNA